MKIKPKIKPKIFKPFCSRHVGMALPLSLIMLLVAGGLVALSMYLVENMTNVVGMKSDDELRLNSAIAGIEEGKKWIVESFAEKYIPRRINAENPVDPTDWDGATATNPQFSFLLARNKGSIPGDFSGSVEGVPFRWLVYDLTYSVRDTEENKVRFQSAMPLNMREPFFSVDGESLVQRTSYSGVSRGGSSGGKGLETMSEFGIYLIRSTSSFKGVNKTVEQALRMRMLDWE